MKRKINPAIKYGYRSGFEGQFADLMKEWGVKTEYEQHKIPWVEPATNHNYTPDHWIPKSKIFIELKGRFTLYDRRKHLRIRQQHPDIEIRFVFQNSRGKINKKSKTTYADWCVKNNFKYCDFKDLTKEFLK